jgi:hypothetical protein
MRLHQHEHIRTVGLATPRSRKVAIKRTILILNSTDDRLTYGAHGMRAGGCTPVVACV